jgi:large subunit ribosomal protein L10
LTGTEPSVLSPEFRQTSRQLERIRPFWGLMQMWREAVDRAEKAELVDSLTEAFKGSGAIVVAHYAGLTVAEMEGLRAQMRQSGAKVRVAKNRLAKLALKKTENADISGLFTGPTLVAYSDDPVSAPKVAVGFANKNKKLIILGGAMGQTELDADGVKALAELPSLDELRAKLAGLVTQPAAKIAAVLQAPGGQVARVISAYSDKGEAA